MMWMVALLLRVVLVNSVRACLCHRVLCFRICKGDDDEEASIESDDSSCGQTLISSLPRRVLPA